MLKISLDTGSHNVFRDAVDQATATVTSKKLPSQLIWLCYCWCTMATNEYMIVNNSINGKRPRLPVSVQIALWWEKFLFFFFAHFIFLLFMNKIQKYWEVFLTPFLSKNGSIICQRSKKQCSINKRQFSGMSNVFTSWLIFSSPSCKCQTQSYVVITPSIIFLCIHLLLQGPVLCKHKRRISSCFVFDHEANIFHLILF